MIIPSPTNVVKSIVSGFRGNTTRVVDEVPEGVTDIDFRGWTNLRNIRKLPSTTRKLNIVGCPHLRSLPALRKLTNLEELSVEGTSLRCIESLPNSLRRLYAGSCRHLRSIYDLPHGLEYVELSGNPQLRLSFLDPMPETLTKFVARDCPHVTWVGTLPPLLKSLMLANTGISRLPALPDTLEDLDISGSPVEQLDLRSTTGLKRLNVSNCTKLRGEVYLPASVESFIGCGIGNVVVLPPGTTRWYF